MDFLIDTKNFFINTYIDLRWSISFPYTFLLTIVCSMLLLKDFHITKANWKSNLSKLILETVLFCAGAILIQCILFAFIENTFLVNQIATFAFIVVYAAFFSKYNFHTRITMVSIYYAAEWAIWRLVNGIFLTNEIIFPNGPMILRDLLSMTRITIATITVVILLKRYTERKSKKVPAIYWLLILFISLASIVSFIYIDFTLELEGYPNFGTYMAIIFLIINLLTYYMYYVMTTEHFKNTERELLNQRTNDENLTMKKNDQLYQNIRTLRHEMKNHISFMQTLLAKKKYETLDEYFRQLRNDDFSPLQSIDCGNEVFNTIINNNLVISKTKGIHFETFIGVPSVLTIKDKDLCSLLSNILDNAFEASCQSKIPVVDLSIKIVNDFLFIKCKNSMAENIFLTNPKLKTTKPDHKSHGLGIKVIKKIADCYNGQAIFEEQDGFFVVTVMLMLPDGE